MKTSSSTNENEIEKKAILRTPGKIFSFRGKVPVNNSRSLKRRDVHVCSGRIKKKSRENSYTIISNELGNEKVECVKLCEQVEVSERGACQTQDQNVESEK